MDKIIVRKKFYRIFNKNFQIRLCLHKYSINKSGLWPFALWFYKWGIGFHGLFIADFHIDLD